MGEKHEGITHYLAPSSLTPSPLWGGLVCVIIGVTKMCSHLQQFVKRGAECRLQFIGRSEGDELCLARLHVAECHTFFALKNR